MDELDILIFLNITGYSYTHNVQDRFVKKIGIDKKFFINNNI